jgi:amidase
MAVQDEDAAMDEDKIDRRAVLALAAAAATGGITMANAAQSAPSPIVMMDAIALSRAIHGRNISCAETMTAYLDHIARLNPRVNAIVSLQDRDGLLAQARDCDAELARGHSRGLMHGFPQAIKDLTAAKGIPMTDGSPLLKDFVPQTDAIMVERMRKSGSIIIGKTNVPEFGLGSHTVNPVFGATLNPYDLTKTCGGSSGGAAVSLALRMLPVADGTDHGGSLRNPGAYNNVYGLRPTYGRVPAEAADVFNTSLSVNGPLARNPSDLAMLLSVQSGYDARMPLSIREDPAPFAGSLETNIKGKRIAWLGDFDGYLPFEPGVLELCRAGLKTFETLGCVVEDARPDFPIAQVWRNWLKLRAWQAGAPLRIFYRDPAKRALLNDQARFEVESFAKLTAADIVDAGIARTAWYQAVRRFLDRYDYFVLPSAQLFPFPVETLWPMEIAGRTMDTYHRWMEVAVIVTMSGCPAIDVPVGFNEKGLPMGMQIAAPHQAELSLLQLAYAYDRATGWVEKRKPALLGA